MSHQERKPRKPASEHAFCAERRDKPFRTKEGLEVMCHALLRRTQGMPAIERVIVRAADPGPEGYTWEVAALVPPQPPAIYEAAQAALKEWQGRYDLV